MTTFYLLGILPPSARKQCQKICSKKINISCILAATKWEIIYFSLNKDGECVGANFFWHLLEFPPRIPSLTLLSTILWRFVELTKIVLQLCVLTYFSIYCKHSLDIWLEGVFSIQFPQYCSVVNVICERRWINHPASLLPVFVPSGSSFNILLRLINRAK